MKKLFPLCAALAAGEALGLLSAGLSSLWPLAVALGVLAAAFGYGLAVRGWPLVPVALLGFVLASSTAADREALYRTKFWMRDRPEQVRRLDESASEGALPRVKGALSTRLAIGLEHDRTVVGLNRAILLGERANLPWRTRQIFVEAGTMHIFAISGLHVMIVAKLLVAVLCCLFVPYRFAGILALPVLWCYVAMIGSPPSAVRAAMMASFYFSAPLFFRRPDSLCAWALTFLLVHLVSPQNLLDVGSALSFTVMFGILFWVRYAERLLLPPALTAFGVTVAAWSAGLPIAAHVFGRITPGGILANLVLIPAATVSVVCGMTGALASFLSRSLAAHLNNLSALFTEAMLGISAAVSRLPGANFEVVKWSFLDCLTWYSLLSLLLLFVWLVRRRRNMI